MNHLIAVAPDKYSKGFPNSAATPDFEPVELREALSREYPTDAHLVTYVVDDETRQPRIKKSGLEKFGKPAHVHCLFCDVDNPDHGDWTEELRYEAREREAKLTVLQTVGVYETAHGLRYIQPLDVPVPVADAERYLAAWLESLSNAGVDADPACKDWTRHYRLPNVVRNGKAYRSPYVSLERMQPVTITPVPPPPPPKPWTPTFKHFDSVEKVRRGRAYANSTPPAIEGQHGDLATYTLCTKLARGFDLSDSEALDCLSEWNAHCSPPWSECELESKISRGRENGTEPIGGMLEERQESPKPSSAAVVTPNTTDEERREAEEALIPHSSHMVKVGEVLDAAKAFFARRFRGEEKPIPLPWQSVGEALGGGFWPGAHVVTGTTAAGKTAFAIQASIHAATAGHPVLYIGLELDTFQIIARLAALAYSALHLSTFVELHWSDIYLGKRDPATIDDALEALRALPIHVEEAPPGGWSCKNLRKRIDELRLQYPDLGFKSPLVVLDFLQLVGPTDPGSRRHEELRERIGAAAYEGREAARKCGVAVLMISSISRAGAKELGDAAKESKLGVSDPADFVGLGKESGDIEFSADSVISMAREKREDGDTGPVPVWLAMAKIRALPACWRLLKFNGSWLEDGGSPEDAKRSNEERLAARKEAKEAASNKRLEREYEAKLTQILRVLNTSKVPLSVEALQAKVGGAKNKFTGYLSDLEQRGLTQQVMSGKRSLGWALVGRSIEADASGRIRTESASVRVREADGLSPLCNRASPSASSSASDRPQKTTALTGNSTPSGLDEYDQHRLALIAQMQAESAANDSQNSETPPTPAVDAIQAAIARGDDAEAERLSGVKLSKAANDEDDGQ